MGRVILTIFPHIYLERTLMLKKAVGLPFPDIAYNLKPAQQLVLIWYYMCYPRLSNDAPTNALINRCGRVGREINSGWNWQPTKNLFSGISTISTKRLSGETPEKTIPSASKISRYLLLNS